MTDRNTDPDAGAEDQGGCSEALQQMIMSDIAEHIRVHGPKNWKLLRERPEYEPIIGSSSEASDRKFWRWRALVAKQMPRDTTRPHEGRAVTDAHRAWSAERVIEAAQRIGAAPPVDFFMKQGANGLVQVNLVAAAQEIWGDLALLREDCFEVVDEQRRVTSPKELERLSRSRTMLLDRLTRVLAAVFNLDDLRRRYEAIIHVITVVLAEHPELQGRVLEAIEAANSGEATTMLERKELTDDRDEPSASTEA